MLFFKYYLFLIFLRFSISKAKPDNSVLFIITGTFLPDGSLEISSILFFNSVFSAVNLFNESVKRFLISFY